MDTSQPYQITTPRGTISLLQQGDYYVEAGSTQDPTRLGVRAGAAQIQSLNGQVLAVRAGEVGELSGDAATAQLRTIQSAPPPQPAAWADRDRQVIYDQPPQYLSSGVTGYEDLNQYGTWINDGSYGEVWVPRSVPSGWAPYRTGHWAYVQPWGWTWIDDQPWGFAPYHYGRWANSGGRWMWVPPQREARPVYAPALVAFVGGIELAATLSRQSSAPVGWFPLGPREAYVPSYTTNRDYYQRINRPAQVQDQVLNERWQRAERHDPAALQNQQHAALMNQRFATVVPATAFVRSQPVMRSALAGGAGQDRRRAGGAGRRPAGADGVGRRREGRDPAQRRQARRQRRHRRRPRRRRTSRPPRPPSPTCRPSPGPPPCRRRPRPGRSSPTHGPPHPPPIKASRPCRHWRRARVRPLPS